MRSLQLLLACLAGSLTTALASSPTDHPSRGYLPRIEHLSRRQLAVANSSASHSYHLSKRGSFSGRATWYDVGANACGGTNYPNQKVVALGQVLWDTKNVGGDSNNNGWCGTEITISYGGHQTTATIVDLCPYDGGCEVSDGDALDMSTSLFTEFADLNVGVFYMEWWVSGSGGNGGSSGSGAAAAAAASSSSAAAAATASSSKAAKAAYQASIASVQSVQAEQSEASVASVQSASSRAAYFASKSAALQSASAGSLASIKLPTSTSSSLPLGVNKAKIQSTNKSAIQSVNNVVLNLANVMSSLVQAVNS